MKRILFNLPVYMLLFCFLPLTAQTTYHVNINNGDDTNDGLKWSTAFESLQTALDKAKARDTVWVSSGIYTPTKKYADKYNDGTPTTDRDCSFIIPDSVVVMGGFPTNPSDIRFRFAELEDEQNHIIRRLIW